MPALKIQPPFLKKHDRVAIVSPSYAIGEDKIESAVRILAEWGLKAETGKNVLKREGPFAGSDDERISDFQKAVDDPSVRAVFCSRGGYGWLRIIDKIDFSPLRKSPKWFIGFSDVTVLHCWLTEKCKITSIHGEMPLNYANKEKSQETLDSLRQAVFGNFRPVVWNGKSVRAKEVAGEITGGNLSLLYSLIGTAAEPATHGKILFIEEVGEYLYHLDRMMHSLRLAGKLRNLKALVVGGMTEMTDSKTPWGMSAGETIASVVKGYRYPVFFNFPAGHVSDNRAFYLGKQATISLRGNKISLSY